MSRAALLVIALMASACGRSHAGEEQLGAIGFKVPDGWQRSDTQGRGTATAVFTPPVNPSKESLTIIRTEIGPVAGKYTAEHLSRWLVEAQSTFAQVKLSPVARVETEEGFRGMRVEVDYVPPGLSERYHRVHVVLVDGSSALVNVIYTAAKPDAELVGLHRVLDTLHEES